MTPVRSYTIGQFVKIEEWTDCIRTTFIEDGLHVVAAPQGDDEYVQRSVELGYKSPLEMNREHDPLHNIICCWMGMPFSPTIYGVASSNLAPERIRCWEESMVLDMQRLLNGRGAVSSEIYRFVPNVEELMAYALLLLRGQ